MPWPVSQHVQNLDPLGIFPKIKKNSGKPQATQNTNITLCWRICEELYIFHNLLKSMDLFYLLVTKAFKVILCFLPPFNPKGDYQDIFLDSLSLKPPFPCLIYIHIVYWRGAHSWTSLCHLRWDNWSGHLKFSLLEIERLR